MPRHILKLCLAIGLMAAAHAGGSTVMVYGFAPTLGGGIVKQQLPVAYERPGDAQGAAALLARISAAAELVCTTRPSALLTPKIARCREQAIRRAVLEVASPALSAAAERS